ncbi:hypothetical protein F4811DRAFT_553848 [Daldinia bambusicola]|nr:hypothetical protein F4811DRAFT_553848 [Daldinia bambusicola]
MQSDYYYLFWFLFNQPSLDIFLLEHVDEPSIHASLPPIMPVPLIIFYLLVVAWIAVGVLIGMLILYLRLVYYRPSPPSDPNDRTALLLAPSHGQSDYVERSYDEEQDYDSDSVNSDEELLSNHLPPIDRDSMANAQRFETYLFIISLAQRSSKTKSSAFIAA